MSRFAPKFGLVLVFGLFLLQVFSVTPFLQQETVGAAYSYASGDRAFFSVLFDPWLNEGGTGRFRYFDYLATSIYWNLVKQGIVPKALYDWLAILVTGLLSLLLFRQTSPRMGKGIALVIASFFLAGTPSFFTAVFHFRPAKILAALAIGIYAAIHQKGKKKRIVTLIFANLTDSFAIVATTLFMLIWSIKEKKTQYFKEWITAIGITFVIVLGLNGVIGPLFNPDCSWRITETPAAGVVYLTLEGIPETGLIMSDLLGLSATLPLRQALGNFLWLLCFLVAFVTHREKDRFYLFVFVLSLPIFAFLLRPGSNPTNLYATYYGYPAFLLFALALSELAQAISQKAVVFLIVLLTANHLLLAKPLVQTWIWDHLEGRRPEVWQKYVADYERLQKSQQSPVEYPPGGKRELLATYRDEKQRFKNATQDGNGRYPHTALYYLLAPWFP